MKKRLQRPTKPKRGRSITRRTKLDATAEEVAQAMFAAARASPRDQAKRRYDSIEEDER